MLTFLVKYLAHSPLHHLAVHVTGPETHRQCVEIIAHQISCRAQGKLNIAVLEIFPRDRFVSATSERQEFQHPSYQFTCLIRTFNFGSTLFGGLTAQLYFLGKEIYGAISWNPSDFR